MTRMACWARKSGNRPARIQGVPAYGTKTRLVYDRLRAGKDVKNYWGILKLLDLYNMEADQIVTQKTGKRGTRDSISYRLKGEWHDNEFYPVERVSEIKVEELDFS